MERTETSYGGRVQSVVNMMNSLMILLTGLLVGFSVSKLSYQVIYLIVGTFGVLAAVLAHFYFKEESQSQELPIQTTGEIRK
ncbi:Major Facilitator Superfamily protein [compost metagenome]